LRTSLRAGDHAKLVFDDQERMWVLIKRVVRKNGRVRYHGELDNCPVVVDMQVMDKVSFGPENVIQYIRRKKRIHHRMKVKQRITLHAPSKKAMEKFMEFVTGCIEDFHDSGEAPIGCYYDRDDEPEKDDE